MTRRRGPRASARGSSAPASTARAVAGALAERAAEGLDAASRTGERLLGFGLDLGYSARRHAVTTLRPASPKRFGPGREGYPTIVALAGIFEPWDFLLPILEGFSREGYPIHVIEALGRNFGGVAELAEYVLADLEAKGVRDAILVGHSKGGLVAKAVLLLARTASESAEAGDAPDKPDERDEPVEPVEPDVDAAPDAGPAAERERAETAAELIEERRPDEGIPEIGKEPPASRAPLVPPRVIGVIAIAAPFRGTRLVSFVRRSRELAAFKPSSRSTVRLRVHDAFDHRIVSILPIEDEIVSDPGRLEKGRNVVIPVHGHARLLSDVRTLHVCLEAARILAAEEGIDGIPEPAPREAAAAAMRSIDAEGRGPLSGIPMALTPGGLRSWARDYRAAVVGQLGGLLGPGVDAEGWRAGRPGGATVVLVPGVFERWWFLAPLGERLHAAGHAVHVVEDLGWNLRDFDASAELLVRELERRELEDVVVVAHSKGGLIAKTAMLRRDAGWRIRHLIAIATPFGGSAYARAFLDPAIRAFSPASPRLRALAREIAANSRITSITPRFDPHIPGDRTLQGAARNLRLPLDGHFAILSEPRLLELVAQLVGELRPTGGASPTSPTPPAAPASTPADACPGTPADAAPDGEHDPAHG
ncbi:hypothetical protein USB125703_00038 [Pseudoclavibacter triregionum]|nr:hypothetical protein USB125703_00038 [Pseudoclavibacter triregionum]